MPWPEGEGKKASSCAWRRFLGISDEPAARQQCSMSSSQMHIAIGARSNCRIKDKMKCGQNDEPPPADHDAWENWGGSGCCEASFASQNFLA